jgi:hypothetical protein
MDPTQGNNESSTISLQNSRQITFKASWSGDTTRREYWLCFPQLLTSERSFGHRIVMGLLRLSGDFSAHHG